MSVSVTNTAVLKERVDWFFYGFVISTILVGATTIQAWTYYTTNQDKWPLRVLVAGLVIMDFALTIMNAEVIRYYLITNFGNLEVFATFSPVLKVEIFCSFIMVFVINIFFASRVYKLHQAPLVVTLIVVVTALGSIIAGLMLSARLFQGHGNSQLMMFYTTRSKVEMGIALVLAAFSEIFALSTISFSLHNSRTGYQQTDTVLKKLFTFFVSRGIILAAAQIIGICVYFVGQHPLNWLTWNFISTKSYGITVLAMLASRSNLRKDLNNTVSLSQGQQSQNSRTTRASNGFSLIQFQRREEVFYDDQLDSPIPKIALYSPTVDRFS
ncbi:hypothetical protein J3R30DRAFT_60451 [Lentinula aciculospora]|uniref:DUF6534 domain-containing protein n=1 Tax=Lentinula aciculospora TaxID=153920 RepID=A0A9W9AV10_9AGAR|nr:hypothetical protein J3R30DRAFT_60451 [Lentinula aciculospora]